MEVPPPPSDTSYAVPMAGDDSNTYSPSSTASEAYSMPQKTHETGDKAMQTPATQGSDLQSNTDTENPARIRANTGDSIDSQATDTGDWSASNTTTPTTTPKPVVAQAIPIGIPLHIAPPPLPHHHQAAHPMFMHAAAMDVSDPNAQAMMQQQHAMGTTGDQHPPEDFSQLMGIRPPPMASDAMLIHSLNGAQSDMQHDTQSAYAQHLAYDVSGQPTGYTHYQHPMPGDGTAHADPQTQQPYPNAHPQAQMTGDTTGSTESAYVSPHAQEAGAAPATPNPSPNPNAAVQQATSDNPTEAELQQLVKQANAVWGDKIDKNILSSLLGLLSAQQPQHAIFQVLQDVNMDEEQKVAEVAKVIKQHLSELDNATTVEQAAQG